MWVNESMIPAESPVNLTTTDIDKYLFDGIEDYYGADLPVDVFVNVTNLYGFKVKKD